jgi:Ca-activated chloride channel family protein
VDGNRDDAAHALAEYVNSISAEPRLSGHRQEANPRWQLFVFAAMICLGGARILGFTPRRKKPSNLGRLRAMTGLLCLFLFSSCARTQGLLLVMEGNFFSTRGLYTEAISSYLRALNYDEAAPYAEYGLGVAYFALEENTAALERFNEAEKKLSELTREDHPELRYRINYNTGIIFFEMGEYDEAAKAFREALKIDGSRIEAKRNLELSLLSLARQIPSQAASSQEESNQEGTGEIHSVLFEYLRQKEREQWRSREWIGESDFSGPDY